MGSFSILAITFRLTIQPTGIRWGFVQYLALLNCESALQLGSEMSADDMAVAVWCSSLPSVIPLSLSIATRRPAGIACRIPLVLWKMLRWSGVRLDRRLGMRSLLLFRRFLLSSPHLITIVNNITNIDKDCGGWVMAMCLMRWVERQLGVDAKDWDIDNIEDF